MVFPKGFCTSSYFYFERSCTPFRSASLILCVLLTLGLNFGMKLFCFHGYWDSMEGWRAGFGFVWYCVSKNLIGTSPGIGHVIFPVAWSLGEGSCLELFSFNAEFDSRTSFWLVCPGTLPHLRGAEAPRCWSDLWQLRHRQLWNCTVYHKYWPSASDWNSAFPTHGNTREHDFGGKVQCCGARLHFVFRTTLSVLY